MPRKKRKYKIKCRRLLIIILLFLSLIYFIFFYENIEKVLKKIGYSKEEINIIKKLSKTELNEIKENKYIESLTKILESKNYDKEKLSLYIDKVDNSEKDANINTIIYMVNNNINYDYSNKINELINNEYFILSRLDRYMKLDSNNISDIITRVNSNADYEGYTNIIKSDVSKDILILVNKYYSLDEEYHYGELVKMDTKYSNHTDSMLSSVAYDAFKKLVDDAEKEGFYIRNNSSYRSFSYQKNLYNNYVKSNGQSWADSWSARPGHSEHQTGLALDVAVKSDLSIGKFGNSKEFNWMKDNSYKYGFILRYPEGKEYITGYGYEPWHYRYVGIDAAKYIYEHNITFDEYYAYFVEK